MGEMVRNSPSRISSNGGDWPCALETPCHLRNRSRGRLTFPEHEQVSCTVHAERSWEEGRPIGESIASPHGDVPANLVRVTSR